MNIISPRTCAQKLRRKLPMSDEAANSADEMRAQLIARTKLARFEVLAAML